MITKDQVLKLAKENKINETVVLREYLQVLFLSRLYSFPESRKIFFKGGTALHLLFKALRFSEDLDFTVGLKTDDFLKLIKKVFKRLSQEEAVEFKERKTIAGKRFLLTANPTVVSYKIFVNLDFSFREKVFKSEKSIMETDYPILFNSYLYHLSKNEIAAEKIRAILTRRKGRDLYDLWFLLSIGADFESQLIKEKLKYYKLGKKTKEDLVKRIESFSKKDFVLDMRPFVPKNEREKLADLFTFLKDFVKGKIINGFS